MFSIQGDGYFARWNFTKWKVHLPFKQFSHRDCHLYMEVFRSSTRDVESMAASSILLFVRSKNSAIIAWWLPPLHVWLRFQSYGLSMPTSYNHTKQSFWLIFGCCNKFSNSVLQLVYWTRTRFVVNDNFTILLVKHEF